MKHQHQLFCLYKTTGTWPFTRKKLVCTFINAEEAIKSMRMMRKIEQGWHVEKARPRMQDFLFTRIWN